MQAAGKRIRAASGLVELAACVQAREYDLDDRHAFFRMHAKRDAASIVFDRHRMIGVQRDCDLLAVAAERLVGGVVDDFLNDVQRIFSAGVHAGPLLDRLETLEHLDRCFAVSAVLAAVGGAGFFRGHVWTWVRRSGWPRLEFGSGIQRAATPDNRRTREHSGPTRPRRIARY